MMVNRVKCLLVAVLSVFSISVLAQHEEGETAKKSFDANEVIFGHIMDANEFHFLS